MKPITIAALCGLWGAGCASQKAEAPAEAPAAAPAKTAAAPEVKVKPAKAQPVPPRPLAQPAPMQTVVQHVPNKPLVSFRLVFHTGSVDDPPGKEGITSLAANVMAEGGTRSLSSSELLKALFPMAAELDVEVDREFTIFSGRVHEDHLDKFFPIFTDVLLEPRWDPKEFERLRADSLSTIRNFLRGEDDETLGKVALEALLYEGHPYAHWPAGTVAGLTAVTLADAQAHAARVFTQDRLVVGLAGKVDAALQKRVLDRLSALPKTGVPRVVLPPVSGEAGRVWIIQKDTASTAVSMGFAYPLRRGDPDFYPVALATAYLGAHRQTSGHLFNELREKRGFNYGDYAYAEHFLEAPGIIPQANVQWSQEFYSLWIRPVEPQNALFVTQGAYYFFNRMVKEGVPAQGLEMNRGFMSGFTRLWEQTDERRLAYAIDELFFQTPHYLEGFRESLSKLTRDQVRAAVARQLNPERLNLVFVTKDAQGLKKQLTSEAVTQMTYPSPKSAEVLEMDKTLGAQRLPIDPSRIEIRDVSTVMER